MAAKKKPYKKQKRPPLGRGLAEGAAKQIEKNKKRKQNQLDNIMKQIGNK